MKLLVCGDRNWTDYDFIAESLDQVSVSNGYIELLIHGAARGADTLAAQYAERRGIPILPIPANWAKYGPSAGPIRNRQMLKDGEPDLVVAFHDSIEQSKGTKDMLKAATAASIRTRLFKHEGSS